MRKILTKKTPDVTPEVGQRWSPRRSRSMDLREVLSVVGRLVVLKNLVTGKTTTISMDTLYKDYAHAGEQADSQVGSTVDHRPVGDMPW